MFLFSDGFTGLLHDEEITYCNTVWENSDIVAIINFTTSLCCQNILERQRKSANLQTNRNTGHLEDC